MLDSSIILDMALGEPATITGRLPSAAVAGARVGLSKESARRARGLVADALCSAQEERRVFLLNARFTDSLIY